MHVGEEKEGRCYVISDSDDREQDGGMQERIMTQVETEKKKNSTDA